MTTEQLVVNEQTIITFVENLKALAHQARARLGLLAAVGTLMAGGTAIHEVIDPASARADAVDDALANYPEKNMPCEHAPYKIDGPCANYDWGPIHTDAYNDPSTFIKRGYGYRNCTDWVAWRVGQLTGQSVSRGLGNGGQWYDNASSAQQASTPKAWDAAVKPGNPGHVAFVESVSADGNSMTISEYNQDGLGHGSQRTIPVAGAVFSRFVDFGVHPSTSPVSPAIARRPGDYNGDGTTDVAVFRPSDSTWHIKDVGVVPWGLSGDIPAPADYNGDGKTDPTVYRPTNGTWYTHSPGIYSAVTQWGLGGDIPVPGDYAGDGIADRAVYRPSNGTWYVNGGEVAQWGLPGDVPAPADYDGNGATDIGVFRPSNGSWHIKGIGVTQWGTGGDTPVPGDYDGNGNTDLGVFRPNNSTWYAYRPGVYNAVTQWGLPGDVPVPGNYGGSASTDYAVFRPGDQTWHVSGRGVTQWGLPGDIPAIATLAAPLLKKYGLIPGY